MSKMLSGTPILVGDNNIPGVGLHKEFKENVAATFEACRKLGLDFYPTMLEFLRYDEISEIASYGGFPVRYPHWRFGMEYEGLSKGYEFNQHRISEMVINSNPCVIYFLDSNSLVENINVLAHALGHNHFFKNNVFFSATDSSGAINKLANNGVRIRQYISRYGKEKVTQFIDHCLRLDTLIDPSSAWKKKTVKDMVIKDVKNVYEPVRIHATHSYMDEWLNTQDRIRKEKERIEKQEAIEQLDIFTQPTKDVMGFLKNHAPLKPWQQDIMTILYEEALYFAPQRLTKMLNEGFASWVDYKIMCGEGLCGLGQVSADAGIIEYAKHKMMVLGGKYSQNPYKLGFELLLDIEERWNKGKFGSDYENCKDISEKEKWDKKLGLGHAKVFEVVTHYNDFLTIQEFFTEDFCERKQFFEYQHLPNGNVEIVNRDFKSIKKKLMQKYAGGGLPDMRMTDPNHLGKGWFFLQHHWSGMELHKPYLLETMTSIYRIWNNNVVVATKNKDLKEIVYVCSGTDAQKVVEMSAKDYEEKYIKKA